MGVEGKIPTSVAESPIKSDQGRVDSLVAPGEFSVQQSDLLEMASVESMPELTHEAKVQVVVVLVCSLVDKIEVA